MKVWLTLRSSVVSLTSKTCHRKTRILSKLKTRDERRKKFCLCWLDCKVSTELQAQRGRTVRSSSDKWGPGCKGKAMPGVRNCAGERERGISHRDRGQKCALQLVDADAVFIFELDIKAKRNFCYKITKTGSRTKWNKDRRVAISPNRLHHSAEILNFVRFAHLQNIFLTLAPNLFCLFF